MKLSDILDKNGKQLEKSSVVKMRVCRCDINFKVVNANHGQKWLPSVVKKRAEGLFISVLTPETIAEWSKPMDREINKQLIMGTHLELKKGINDKLWII